ncbi:hypothetical protein C3729_02245 [Cloacibacterium normanense]|jgi:hypothetical protein|uniref:Lipoprotein n=1 Tax=Cloacibacterium normanense TaxID=237258 RepID=A0A2S7I8F1_9FLAO|nr:hypothetical protein C3729_02245 [Cloacibacterium normanense]
MKSIIVSTAFLLFLLGSCKKRENKNETVEADSIMTQDSLVSGTSPQSPDTDTTRIMDSTAYDLDSIKKSK